MLIRILCSILLVLTLCSLPAGATDSLPSEYGLKAAFLYNFAKFIDWPPSDMVRDNDILVLGILGDDPFGDSIGSIKGRAIKGKRLVVRHVEGIEDGAACHILFISNSERRRLKGIIRALNGFPVLTVADHEGLSQSGVMINLVMTKNTLGFDINRTAVAKARLQVSSQLFKLAREVVE